MELILKDAFKKLMSRYAQFIKFGMVGVLNTAITILSFNLFVSVLGIGYVIANVLSFGLGVVNSFIINSRWVFRSRGDALGKFVKFITVNLINLGISTGVIILLVENAGLLPIVAQPFAAIVTVLAGFILNKKWVFKQ